MDIHLINIALSLGLLFEPCLGQLSWGSKPWKASIGPSEHPKRQSKLSFTTGMDIVAFAEQFLSKLEELPAKFSSEYNAPQKRTESMSSVAEASSRKATVRIVEVALKDLRGGVVAKTKLSRTEPALTKLRNEASQMLGCPIDCVVLVQKGQVLGDERVEEVTAIASSTPVYVFDSREWRPRGLFHSDTFKADLISLLEKHNAPGPDKLAMRFIEALPQWLE